MEVHYGDGAIPANYSRVRMMSVDSEAAASIGGSTFVNSDAASRTSTHLAGQGDASLHEKLDSNTTTLVSPPISTLQNGNSTIPKVKSYMWHPTFLRMASLAGLFCVMLATSSMIAALAILMGSQGDPKDSWSIPPSTYLAVCTAIANQTLRFAAFQGAVISWWYSALRGNTIGQLHRKWKAGMTFGGALSAGRGMGLIGLASIFSTLVAIDGPLLQKATTIDLTPIVAPPIPLNVTMAQEVPTDFTGWWDLEGKSGVWSIAFNKTIPTVNAEISNLLEPFRTEQMDNQAAAWFRDDKIAGVVSGCPKGSMCNATVRAPALAATSCVSHSIPVDYWRHLQKSTVKNILQITGTVPPLNTLAFLVEIDLMLEHGAEHINLITGHGRSQNCTGVLDYNICTLVSAIGEYNVTVQNDEVIIGTGEPRIVALANNTRVNHEWEMSSGYPSTLAGIVDMSYRWSSGAYYYFDVDQGTVIGSGWQEPVWYTFEDGTSRDEQCRAYLDPHDAVLHNLNNLMFRIGATAALQNGTSIESHLDPDLPIHTTTQGYLQGTQEVFQTNLRWFGAAALLELISIALILPTYFGWWRLGRAVSFSPLETAKAFEAPLLSDCNSNSSGRDIAKTVGTVTIKYGVVKNGASAVSSYVKMLSGSRDCSKLAFADPSMVDTPQAGTDYGASRDLGPKIEPCHSR